jgi:hypothetical protein
VPLRVQVEPVARPAAPAPAAVAEPAVRLGFSDGSSLALDDGSKASRDLIAVAGVLVGSQLPPAS